MARPRIDVLLPVKTARRTMPAALADVLAQRDVDVRVIAVVDTDPDDDDGSAAWLLSEASRERRLVVHEGRGQGAADALQLALKQVTAPLVSHMEADDRCPPDRLARLADALLGERRLAGVTSRVGQFGATTPGMRRYLDWQNALLTHESMAAERFVEIPALHQTGLYRASALRAIGGYRVRGDWPPDIDFWFRWFEHDRKVIKLPRVLYRWRQHPRQATRGGGQHDPARLRAAKIDALERLHGRRGSEPRRILLLSTGATLRTWNRELHEADIDLLDCREWRPGQAAYHLLRRRASWAGRPLILGVYGMPSAREALRTELKHPREPDELLFTA